MDPVDLAFQESLVPEGAIPIGFISVLSYVDKEGAQCWKLYNQLDMPLSNILGLLEMAKHDIIRRSSAAFPPVDDDG